jgi:hypothetical protein
VTVLVFNETSTEPDTIEVFYTASPGGQGAKIKAFTATNDTVTSQTYKAYIYSSAGGLVGSIVPLTEIARDRADFGPTAINQDIPAGGSLRVECSTIGGLNFYVTGNEL